MMTPYALYGLLEAEKAGYSINNPEAVKRGLARLHMFIENMTSAELMDRIFCMYVYGMRHDLEPQWWKFIEEELQQKRLSDYAWLWPWNWQSRKFKRSSPIDSRPNSGNGQPLPAARLPGTRPVSAPGR